MSADSQVTRNLSPEPNIAASFQRQILGQSTTLAGLYLHSPAAEVSGQTAAEDLKKVEDMEVEKPTQAGSKTQQFKSILVAEKSR